MWRKIFRDVTNPELFLPLGDVQRIMAALAPPAGDPAGAQPELTAVVETAVSWSAEQARWFGERLDAARERGRADLLVRTLIVGSAPMASALGCWNQGASAPGVFEDEVQLRVLALLAADVGAGRAHFWRYDEFTALAKRHGAPEIAVEPYGLSSERAVPDQLFSLAAALYAASRRSDALGPEIAGIDLVLRSIGCLPWWSALRAADRAGIDWDRLDLSTAPEAGAEPPLEVSRWVAEQYAALGDETRRRVVRGAAWTAAALRRWTAVLADGCREVFEPDRAMANLLRARAREGSVYHHHFSLAGRDLSSWLRQAVDDPAPLLAVLARSRLVRPGNSARSALVNGLLGWRGPMFRVFSPEDVAIISRWIDWLPEAGRDGDDTPSGAPEAAGHTPAGAPEAGGDGAAARGAGTLGGPRIDPPEGGTPPADAASAEGVEPESVREAYFVLQGRALAPRTRGFAIRYVRKWLAQAELSLDRSDRSLPPRWPSEGLRPWLLDQHDRHGAEFADDDPDRLPSREEIVDSTLQLAPLTLIDGAWLQGFTELSLASSQVGAPLFETYWDELGNGQVPLNHPKIYRDVLRDMGIELAPTGSREFAYDPRFEDASFRRPVYWLCLGKLPLTFLPEILGMNLAMELSGVGGSYRTARRFLKHYGFSTQFVDIHNTIDNVSTGHSAWAADAIDSHMSRVVARSTGSEREDVWRRVRIGYESLAPLPGRRARLIGYRFASPWRAARPRTGDESLFHHVPVKLGS
ncbi:iron-containing redox enzyme family protein [Micromonospora sp. NPDC049559]|uniref:iron-containing redox enzyme family protein n=1 Tax=Micromonospora sp. NPDC049559 TaxID=3155923 RepID=UPI0034375F30